MSDDKLGTETERSAWRRAVASGWVELDQGGGS